MENDDTQKSKGETSKELRPSSSNAQANAKTNRPKQTGKESKKHKKWSLKRHWQRATRKEQVKWVAEGVGILIALTVLGGSIFGNFLSWIGSQPSMAIKEIYIVVNPTDQTFNFDAHMINNSSSAATSFMPNCALFLNGISVGQDLTIPSKPVTVGPHTEGSACMGQIPSEAMKEIVRNGVTLDLYIYGSYEGLWKTFHFCSKEEYAKYTNRFADIGDCNATKPFPQ
jgi:hypothetical protein